MRTFKFKSDEEKSVELLQSENAELLLLNATQDMLIAALQDENAELMLRIATLETGGTA